jgi:hypothetical protein
MFELESPSIPTMSSAMLRFFRFSFFTIIFILDEWDEHAYKYARVEPFPKERLLANKT